MLPTQIHARSRCRIIRPDVYHSGIVLTTVCALIALLSLIYLALTLCSGSRPTGRAPLATRTLPLQSATLAFCSLWLFATVIPFTDFFANNEAKVTAFAGSMQIPSVTIQGAEAALGATTVYRHIDYLRLVAILPWFTVLFSSIASVVLFLAGRRRTGEQSGLSEKQELEAQEHTS